MCGSFQELLDIQTFLLQHIPQNMTQPELPTYLHSSVQELLHRTSGSLFGGPTERAEPRSLVLSHGTMEAYTLDRGAVAASFDLAAHSFFASLTPPGSRKAGYGLLVYPRKAAVQDTVQSNEPGAGVTASVVPHARQRRVPRGCRGGCAAFGLGPAGAEASWRGAGGAGRHRLGLVGVPVQARLDATMAVHGRRPSCGGTRCRVAVPAHSDLPVFGRSRARYLAANHFALAAFSAAVQHSEPGAPCRAGARQPCQLDGAHLVRRPLRVGFLATRLLHPGLPAPAGPKERRSWRGPTVGERGV